MAKFVKMTISYRPNEFSEEIINTDRIQRVYVGRGRDNPNETWVGMELKDREKSVSLQHTMDEVVEMLEAASAL